MLPCGALGVQVFRCTEVWASAAPEGPAGRQVTSGRSGFQRWSFLCPGLGLVANGSKEGVGKLVQDTAFDRLLLQIGPGTMEPENEVS